MRRLQVASFDKPDYSPAMLGRTDENMADGAGAVSGTAVEAPVFESLDGDFERGLILVCDHATNIIPPQYQNLGLSDDQLSRHIAYDIGVDGVTRQLSELLNVPAVLSRYSRLLIDPNRGRDDPTMVMRISDGAVIPGNARITQDEIDHRVRTYYEPYNAAVAGAIEHSLGLGVVPALLSIHSFTPSWRGKPRPWHAGVLWDRDARFPLSFLEALNAQGDLVVGSNEPYSGELQGDMMNRHGTQRGIAHALLEIRQDLIADDTGIREWAERLAGIMPPLVADENMHYMLESAG